MVEVVVKNISNYVLKDVNAKFPSRVLSVILGPNGAGKTTLLKVIAGLMKYEGNVFFDGVAVDNVPPNKRGIAYVPQNNALFRHMTVWDNIAFGLKIRGLRSDEIRFRVSELMKMLGIEHLARRYPSTLSGGEAKKVAIARALAINPKVLMLDEPFEGLDLEYRYLIEQEIIMSIRKLRVTVLLVTHDVSKAFSIADNLTLLWEGRAVFNGSVSDFSTDEVPLELRFWLGVTVNADQLPINYDPYPHLRLGSAVVPLIKLYRNGGDVINKRKILIPSTSVRVCRRGSVAGIVTEVISEGKYSKVLIDLGGIELPLTTPLKLRRGEEVRISIDNAIIL